MMPCSLVNMNSCFRGTTSLCSHLQSRWPQRQREKALVNVVHISQSIFLIDFVVTLEGTEILHSFVSPCTRNVGNNLFSVLPPHGLDGLLHLKTFNNPNLREFPSPEHFPRIQSLVLSYAYHCCAFLPLIPAEPPPRANLHETVLFPNSNEFDMSLWNSSLTDVWPQLRKYKLTFLCQKCNWKYLLVHFCHNVMKSVTD